jgi:multidrug resistance efflux pump
MSHVPNWMIRWGTTVIFFIVFLLIFVSWMIKYPDVINGSVTLTTAVPPSRIVAQQNGMIKNLAVADQEDVTIHQTLAQMENPLSERAANQLQILIDSVDFHLNNKSLSQYKFPENLPQLGLLQEPFNSLRKLSKEYNRWSLDGYAAQNKHKLEEQLKYYKRLSGVLSNQLVLSKKELANATDKLASDEHLFQKGVISKVAFFEAQSSFTSKEKNLNEIKTQLFQNNITSVEIEKQLLEIKYEQDEKLTSTLLQIESLLDLMKKEVVGWEQNYLLKAPFAGKINYLQPLSENDYIEGGTPIFAVVPDSSELIGYIQIPPVGVGKIKKRQKVNIRLADYPSHEFGQIRAEVVSVAEIANVTEKPKENGYLVKIKLTNGLETTYKKRLDFSAEMKGSAEIITDDLRIIERIFNQFTTLFDN